MKQSQAGPREAAVFFVVVFTVFSAWSFWDSLLYVEGRFYDLLVPTLYGLVAIVASIIFFINALSARYSLRLRLPLVFAGIALLGMPFVFYHLKSPLLETISYIIYWLISLATVAGTIYLSSSNTFNHTQRAWLVASAIAAALAPFTPWIEWLFSTVGNSMADWPYLYWTYGTWLAIGIWGWTGIQMFRTTNQPANQINLQMTFAGPLFIGLGLFFIGVVNPVSLSSDTYRVETYIGGQLVNSQITDLPSSMNLPLVAGSFLILISLVFKTLLRPPALRN